MARLIPKLDPREIANPGESLVAAALMRQLPREVEVFHGFHWIGIDPRGGTLTDFETDFVLIDPAHGLLIVEVKGGALAYVPEARAWRRQLPNGRVRLLDLDPLVQARRSMHGLIERIRAAHPARPADLGFTFGFAVAMPDCAVTGSLPPSLHPDLLLDAEKCIDLQASVARAFARFRRPAHRALSPEALQAVHEALFPRYALVPVIWRKIDDQEERLRRLTATQQGLLDFLGQHRQAAIRGVAGSGKTLLALAKAQAGARQGLRMLLLCYNRPLKQWLRQAVAQDLPGELVIDNFHGLTDAMCRKAGIAFDPEAHPDARGFWRDVAPELLMQACEQLGPEHKFDGIVIDEGQDFSEMWFTALDAAFKDPALKAAYYVFYDPNQTIYAAAPAVPPELGTPYELPVNCRNTQRIAAHCATLIGRDAQVREDAPLGDEPVEIDAPGLREAFARAARQVRAWCAPAAGRGLRRAQVAILAPGSTERHWPERCEPEAGTRAPAIPLTRDFDRWRADGGVLIASWARFKGLESDAIVVVETPGDDAVNRYVARSRAKHLLTIVRAGRAG